MAQIDLKPVQPDEAIAYFRQKGYRIGFDHRDVWRQEHQAAFTVAKAMQIDLLREIREELDAALVDGTTLETFRKNLMPRLAQRGWVGRQEMVDPVTGEKRLVQLGSARRLKTIFETNLATAYSEGRWEKIQRGKEIFGFLEYVRSASAHPRDTHLAYTGLVLPVDDAFWQSHLPVKEYGCKCTVIQHRRGSLEREGLQVGTAPPEVMRQVVNKRTGEVMEVPLGVDPAFHFPPGGRRANLGRMMMDKADRAGAATAARVLAGGVAQWAPLVQSEFAEFVGRYAQGERREVGQRRVVGAFMPAVVAGLQAAGVAPPHATIFTNQARLHHLIGGARSPQRQAKGAGVDFVTSLPLALTQVGEAWLDGDKVVLLATSEEPGRVVKVVVQLDAKVHRDQVGNAVVSMELIKAADFGRKGLVRLDQAGNDGALR